MIRFCSFLFLPIFLIAPNINHNKVNVDRLLLPLKQELYRAQYLPTEERLLEVKIKLERLVEISEQPWLVLYYLAHSNTMLMERFLRVEDASHIENAKQQAKQHLEKAIELQKKSLEIKDYSDGQALLANLCSYKIGFEPMAAQVLGKMVYDYYEKARGLDEENPRIYLLEGISKFYTPVFFGGGKEQASKCFEIAMEKFEAQKKQNDQLTVMPTWGEDITYTWLGHLAELEGNLNLAESYFNMALKVNKHNYWVKDHLLPQLKKKNTN